jgi:hypothetical protein
MGCTKEKFYTYYFCVLFVGDAVKLRCDVPVACGTGGECGRKERPLVARKRMRQNIVIFLS